MTTVVCTLFCVNLYLVPCSHTFTCRLISFILPYLICVCMFVCLYSYIFICKCMYLSILQHPHYEYYVQLRCQCKS